MYEQLISIVLSKIRLHADTLISMTFSQSLCMGGGGGGGGGPDELIWDTFVSIE